MELSGVSAMSMLLRGMELKGILPIIMLLSGIELRGMELSGIELNGMELRGSEPTDEPSSAVRSWPRSFVVSSVMPRLEQSRPKLGR
jgi:hypothetical protein